VRRGELDAVITVIIPLTRHPHLTELAADPMRLATSPDHPSPAVIRSRSPDYANDATTQWSLWSGLWGLLQRMLMPIR